MAEGDNDRRPMLGYAARDPRRPGPRYGVGHLAASALLTACGLLFLAPLVIGLAAVRGGSDVAGALCCCGLPGLFGGCCVAAGVVGIYRWVEQRRSSG